MPETDIATGNQSQFVDLSRLLRRNNIRTFRLNVPEIEEAGDVENILRARIRLAEEVRTTSATPRRHILAAHEDGKRSVIAVANGGVDLKFFESHNGTDYKHPLSEYILKFHAFSSDRLTCRPDHTDLAQFTKSGSVCFDRNPERWIMGNGLFDYLSQSFYKKLIAYNLNERGMFPKVWTLESQKNYWNSSLNGGLPIIRKRDQIHEGTFMLHDIFHFVFRDPVITSKESVEEQRTYVAYRMMSEAWTLVLADMISVSLSGLEGAGYDTSSRKAYPLFKSMNLDPTNLNDLRSLLYANSIYCLFGKDQEFRNLGAGSLELEDYKSKYGIFFSVDAQWNEKNIENIIKTAEVQPKLKEYTSVLPSDVSGWNTRLLYQRVGTPEGQISVNRLFGIFWEQLSQVIKYDSGVSHLRYAKQAIRNYLSGQLHIVFQFPSTESSQLMSDFQAAIRLINDSQDLEETLGIYEGNIGKMNEFIDKVYDNGQILPHERVVYRLGVPHFPPLFFSYDKPQQVYTPLEKVSEQAFAGSLVCEVPKFSHAPISAELKQVYERIISG